MGQRMHFFELADADVRVNFRRGQLRVAQDRLDEADIGAIGEHMSRHRMAKEVRGAGGIDAGGAQVLFDHVAQAVFAEGLTELVHEDIPLVGLDHEI